MKPACLVLFALLLGASTLAAQSSNRSFGVMSQAPGADQQPAVNPPGIDTRCPVSMRAQHLADGEMVRTGKAKPQGIGQWLHLTFIAPDSRRIATATLTIRGSSPKGRVAQVGTDRSDSSDATTALTAAFNAGPDRRDVVDLWVPGMTAVRLIEVNGIVYNDGSDWKPSGSLTCRVAPDLFMPVANR